MSLIISSCRKDFVLYVGGCVWALDWCPKVNQRSGCHFSCEVFIFLLLCPALSQLLEGSLCVWVNFEDFTYIWRLMIDAHKQAYIF